DIAADAVVDLVDRNGGADRDGNFGASSSRSNRNGDRKRFGDDRARGRDIEIRAVLAHDIGDALVNILDAPLAGGDLFHGQRVRKWDPVAAEGALEIAVDGASVQMRSNR